MDFGGHEEEEEEEGGEEEEEEEEEEMGMPMSVSYDSIHESSKLKMLSVSNGGSSEEIRPPDPAGKKMVRYRECLKNHAASIGGHAVDGCGEFMASGEEGTLEALRCAACNCHRNFHRREVDGEGGCCYYCTKDGIGNRRRTSFLHVGAPLALPGPGHMSLLQRPMAFPGEAEPQDPHMTGGPAPPMAMAMAMAPLMKKRFRTKFTQEQKEKMFVFAEKVGWRIQKHDEAAVQQFCVDAGVKRHVLKVWMHNNKHTLGKKL